MIAQQANAPRLRLRKAERRRHSRVCLTLVGRYMMADRQEYPCETIDMSPGGVLLRASVCGALGDKVIVYLEHLGRIEGTITRHVPEGFALSISAAARKRDKLASQLTWLANRQALGLPEDRRHERITPRIVSTTIKLESGRTIPVRLVDLSMSGASMVTDHKPALGVGLLIGSTTAKVVRHFPDGIAVEFRLPLSPDRFDESVIL